MCECVLLSRVTRDSCGVYCVCLSVSCCVRAARMCVDRVERVVRWGARDRRAATRGSDRLRGEREKQIYNVKG